MLPPCIPAKVKTGPSVQKSRAAARPSTTTKPLQQNKLATKVTAKPQELSAKVIPVKARHVPVKTTDNKTEGAGATSLQRSTAKNNKPRVLGSLEQSSSAAPKRHVLSSKSQAVTTKSHLAAGKRSPPLKRLQQASQFKPKPAAKSRAEPERKSVGKKNARRSVFVKSAKKHRPSSSFAAVEEVGKDPTEAEPTPTVVSDEFPLVGAADKQSADVLTTLCRTPESQKHKHSAADSSMFTNMGSAGSTPFQPSCGAARKLVEMTPRDRLRNKRTPLQTISSGELSGDSFKTAAETTQDIRDLADSGDGSGDDLDGTFTLEDEDKVASPAPAANLRERRGAPTGTPSSCLRKSRRGSTSFKKSVSFSVTGTQDSTPKRLPKTPRRGRTISESINAWLKARGSPSISKLRHSSCFEECTPEPATRKTTPRKSGQHRPKATPAATPLPDAATPLPDVGAPEKTVDASETDAIPDKDKLSLVLKELRGHLTESQTSSQDVCTRLDQLVVKCPKITDYSDYWICRSLGHRNAGNDDKALEALFLGSESAKDDNEDLLAMTKELDEKMSVKENVEPPAKSIVRQTRRITSRELLDISMDNVFSSTVIAYKVCEATSVTRVRAAVSAEKSSGTAVMTPVRRSSRHAPRRSNVLVPDGVLYKPNPALDDL
ncbi:hypothetical protein HPB47_003767 [Ixodes persulcatus]|uniref:Uncharacterized protein n=1 Tax=Ixodes persulcatus TaxID=34615 RepID=A0AC60PHL0_IXOPE|nr:hypothetical protein HPB47_003767 [Ixodes persulcatus]